jgi:hypothetical protein
MIEGMGVGPAGSLLGAVAIALVPVPILFHYYGARLREKSTFAPTFVSLRCRAENCDKLTFVRAQVLFRQPRQPRQRENRR